MTRNLCLLLPPPETESERTESEQAQTAHARRGTKSGQPLHDEDDGEKGGNTRYVIFDGRPDNLHWIWDTGLLEHINRNENELAAELERRITPRERAEWEKGSIEDWVLEGHRLAQAVAYGDLGNENPAPITPAYSSRRTR